MRWPFLLMIALAGPCDWPGTAGSTGTTGAGGGDGGTHVNCAASACGDCYTCAINSPCASEAATCQANDGCLFIATCVNGCPDATCRQGCYAQRPDGVSAYQAFNACAYCEQCPCTGLCMQ